MKKEFNIVIFNYILLQYYKYFLENLEIKFKHVITTNLEGFVIQKDNIFDFLKDKTSNNILVSTDYVNDEIVNFQVSNLIKFIPSLNYSVNYKNRIIDTYWAADENIFYPEKDNSKIIILIDDCHYNIDEENNSYEILDFCIDLMLKNEKIEIYRFGYYDNHINFIDKYKNLGYLRYNVIENKMSIVKKSKYHNKANIFWCTHKETLGIPNIESAMSGCLLVYPKNFIDNELTKNLMKIEYDNIIDITYDKLISNLDEEKQRKLALEYTWERKIERAKFFID